MRWHTAHRRRNRKRQEPAIDQIRRALAGVWDRMLSSNQPMMMLALDLATGEDCYVEATFQRQADGSFAIVAVDRGEIEIEGQIQARGEEN